jgi:hypothetical protein
MYDVTAGLYPAYTYIMGEFLCQIEITQGIFCNMEAVIGSVVHGQAVMKARVTPGKWISNALKGLKTDGKILLPCTNLSNHLELI